MPPKDQYSSMRIPVGKSREEYQRDIDNLANAPHFPKWFERTVLLGIFAMCVLVAVSGPSAKEKSSGGIFRKCECCGR